MTESEYKCNNIIGYGILPCMILAIISTCFVADWIQCGSEMGFGLVIITIILFSAWCSIWISLVELVFKIL